MTNEHEEQEASTSLCYTCKHGMCFRQKENATIQNIGQIGIAKNFEEEEEDELSPFAAFEAAQEQQEQGPAGHYIEIQRIVSLCYYQVEGFENNPPGMHLGLVDQCNRYKKEQ